MEFKGTKGKWKIGVLGSVNTEYGNFICESENYKASEEENKANNLLISKSPEMLEMLVQINDWIEKDINPSELKSEIENLIKEATEIKLI